MTRQPAGARGARAAGGVPPEDDPVAGSETLDAVTDAFDGAGPLVPEQQRKLVAPAVLLDGVQVAVADAGRIDPHAHLARPGLADDDLLQRHLAGRGEDYTLVSHERSRSRIE